MSLIRKCVLVLMPLLLLSITVGCGPSYKVAQDYDPRLTYERYRSYSWLDASSGGPGDTELWGQRIRQAVNTDLVGRGMEPIPKNADLFVSWKIAGDGGSEPSGRLSLQFVDAKTMEIVWRGWAEGAVSSPSSPTESQDQVNEVVGKILAQYPPTGG